MRGGHFLVSDSKTTSHPTSGLNAKHQSEISCNKVRNFLGLLEGENAGKGGRELYKERGKCILVSKIKLSDPKFENMSKICAKIVGNIPTPLFVFVLKNRSQLRPACKKSEIND